MVDYGQMIGLLWSKLTMVGISHDQLTMIEADDGQHDQPLDHCQT